MYVHMFLCGFVRVGFFVYIVCILGVFISTYTNLYLLYSVWVWYLFVLGMDFACLLVLRLSINFSVCQYHSWLILIYICLSQCFDVSVCVCVCVCVWLYCAGVFFFVSSCLWCFFEWICLYFMVLNIYTYFSTCMYICL
jgi:hypothetical protein